MRAASAFQWIPISTIALASSPIGVLVSASAPRMRREPPSRLHREIISMAHTSGSKGMNAVAHVPKTTKRIRRLLMEGSTDGDGEVDPNARNIASEALLSDIKALIQEASAESGGGGRAFPRGDAGIFGDARDLSGLQDGLFYLVLVLIVGMAVGNLVTTENLPLFTGPQYERGIKGSDFERISPCSEIPLSYDETFGYLPIMAGLFEDLGVILLDDKPGEVSIAINWFMKFLGLEEMIRNAPEGTGECLDAGETCSLTSECCSGDVSKNEKISCELNELQERQCEAGFGHVWEPFCLLWSESNGGIDTLSFKPYEPWPPIQFIPFTPSLLPLCKPTTGKDGVKLGCKACDYHTGFPVGQFSIGPIPFKVTAKFDGIAVSWASPGKLAFDPNYEIEIWTGFRNIELPRVDGINFWLGLQFEVMPLPFWEFGKAICEKDSTLTENVGKAAVDMLQLTLKMDLFVSVDTTDGTALASEIGENIAGKNKERRNLSETRRELEDDDPCVIVTAAARFSIPLLGTLTFGSIAGGYCTFPEENGNRCTPSGAFLNVNQEFKIEGGASGVLASFLEGLTGSVGMEPQKAGNSLGVFMNDGEFEAVVLRLEAPVVSLFGVTVPGFGRPIIHFQYMKGSEIQRRRESILRTRMNRGEWGPWVPNCNNLASEDICDNNIDDHWAEFGDQSNVKQTQICKNILINPASNDDKLMYYNRVIAAELKNPRKESDNYLIRPPNDSKYQAPARFDFANNPDANIIILHLGLEDFGNFVIAVREISLSLIFSDGPEPVIDNNDKEAALASWNALADTAKDIWRPPSGWYFPGLDQYLDHLPEDSNNIADEEIDAANTWNSKMEGFKNDGLRAYVRIFCKIAVLFFLEISLGLIMMNFADGNDPNKWTVAAQFETSLLGLIYSVSVSTTIDFDRRRHRHLGLDDYHRALATSGLQGADYDVRFDAKCAPDSFCEAFVQFFEDVGAAIWDGLQKIGEFFIQDIVTFAQEAIALVGEWGKAFVGAIEDFANGVRDLFLDGAVGDVLNSERVQAFNEDAHKAVETWTDGRFTLDDITAVGKLILDGVQIAVDFIVAGVTDIVNAVGDFFSNAGKAISKCFSGAEWDEARHSGWRGPSECAAQCDPGGSPLHVKERCWCQDEFGCRVKVPQKRHCKKNKLTIAFWNGCKTECGSWRDLPEKVLKNGNWRFPRFEGRKFDGACREERMAKLAEAEKRHGKMKATGKVVDSNFQTNFNGLNNFSRERRRQRRLKGESAAKINSVSFQGIQATSNGVLLDNVMARGRYDGSQLSPNSTDIDEVQRNLTVRGLDFSSYGNPGSDNSMRFESNRILLQFQRNSAGVFLEKQKLDDDDFMSRQPVILPPRIELTGAAGTDSDPVVLPCSGSLAEAWSLKLNSAEPQVMRRRRTKEVGHFGTFETVIEFPAEATIRQMILNGTIPITIIPGGSSEGEEDVLGDARILLGTEGVGAFMHTTQRTSRRANLFDADNLSDYEWEVDVVTAEPLCDKLQWTFTVTATDRTGTSNHIELYAHILYGETEVNNVPTIIQTRCDTSSINVEDLEYDFELKDMTGYNSFTPSISSDNCPSPYVHLVHKEDIEANPGMPCTTDYKTIQRFWDLDVHTENIHSKCPVPNSTAFPLIQTFTLGGLADEIGLPATPEFDLRPVTYYLPNVREASVATSVSDLLVDKVLVECGLCNNSTENSVFYGHPDDFVCDDHGTNTVSVRVLNRIGIEVTKTTTVTVIDDKPPNIPSNMVDTVKEVLEDGSVRGVVDDVETWDNCKLKSHELIDNVTMGHLRAGLSFPDYEYFPDSNYYGPDNFTWMVADWQGNPSIATVGFDVLPVNDPPYIYQSDRARPFAVLASDVDDAELRISAKHTVKGGREERDGLPSGLSFNGGNCNPVERGGLVAPGEFPWAKTAPNAFRRGSECSWVLSQSDKAVKGVYNITLSVSDNGGDSGEVQTHSIVVDILVDGLPSTSNRIIPSIFFSVVASSGFLLLW